MKIANGKYGKVRWQGIFVQAIIPTFFTLLFLKYNLGKDNQSIQNIFSFLYVLLGMTTTFIYMIKIRKEPLIFLFLFFLYVLGVFSALFGENYRAQDVALLFTYSGLALLPLYNRLNFKVVTFLYYLLLVFFLYHIIIGTHRDDIFSSSGNFISELLLIAMGYHLISATQNNKKPHLLLFIASFGVVIWAYGRSGILVFLMFLFAYPFIVRGKRIYKILTLLLFFAVLSFIVFYFYNELLFLYEHSRFTQKGFEAGHRAIIREQYWNETTHSFVNLILGTPLEAIPRIVSLNFNSHNSFIRLHSFYGLLGFLLVILSLLRVGFYYLRSQNYVFLVLLVALLLRAFVDTNAFHGPFDPLIYYLIIFSFLKQESL